MIEKMKSRGMEKVYGLEMWEVTIHLINQKKKRLTLRS